MEFLLTMVVPLTISGVALYGAGRRVDVYAALIHGAGEGWRPCCVSCRPWWVC